MDRRVLLLLFMVAVGSAYGLNNLKNSERCPTEPRCYCKWSSGRRLADCSGARMTSVPTTLSHETQALIMDSNPIDIIGRDEFRAAGLSNLQKISLRSCQIREIDEHAFAGLRNLGELDISMNNLTELKPKTFDGNDGLQILKLANNPIWQLVAFQFPPLRNLKTVDFSNCRLRSIDRQAFKNLGTGVESVALNSNELRSVFVETFIPLVSLKTLHLHNNPWHCDCKLKNFRDFVIRRKLYSRPTQCAEPARLHDKMWDDVSARDFACKPKIRVPSDFVFGRPGLDATLSCHITGSPKPTARWVVKGRIVNNNTSPAPFASQKWILREDAFFDGVQRWYNLTVTNADYDNLGDYLCVAENNGGVMEKTVTLTFDDPTSFNTMGGGLTSESMVVIGAITASLLFIALMVALVCCCCLCRNGKPKESKSGSGLPNNGSISAYGDDHRRLLTDVSNNATIVATPGRYHDGSGAPLLGHYSVDVTDLADLRAPSVVSSQDNKTTNSSQTSFHSNVGDYVPDLIHHHHHHHNHKKTSTPLSASTLMAGRHCNGSHHRVSPSPSSSSSAATPFTRSGTLPLNSRSVSCDHSQTLRLHSHAACPQVISQRRRRPGYVTLPRRPRASWSAPPRESPTPSTGSAHALYATTMKRGSREPIYDGVGPRTSADGSSRISLSALPNSKKKSSNASNASVTSKYALPPYCAPIAELQECGEDKRVAANTSSCSDVTLVEESISSYCEPFGKAVVPADLDAIIPPPPEIDDSNRLSLPGDYEGGTKDMYIPPMMPLLPPILKAGEPASDSKKVPPKTLPKPKVRPVPPPKPKKSVLKESPAPVVFQDEGADGSEV